MVNFSEGEKIGAFQLSFLTFGWTANNMDKNLDCFLQITRQKNDPLVTENGVFSNRT